MLNSRRRFAIITFTFQFTGAEGVQGPGRSSLGPRIRLGTRQPEVPASLSTFTRLPCDPFFFSGSRIKGLLSSRREKQAVTWILLLIRRKREKNVY